MADEESGFDERYASPSKTKSSESASDRSRIPDRPIAEIDKEKEAVYGTSKPRRVIIRAQIAKC